MRRRRINAITLPGALFAVGFFGLFLISSVLTALGVLPN